MPRSPSLRISVLHRAASYSAEASGRTPESWSPSAKRASRSFGVIRSNPWNSVMLPQRLATWLSATLNMPGGIAEISRGMVRRLKMPWRKSLNTTASRLLGPDLPLASRSTISSEIERLSSVSTLSSR